MGDETVPERSSFQFLHVADIHLDSPLRGLEGHERRIADQIRSAPRDAFENLVGYAIEEAVDFLIIAGDLYDGSWKDYRTGLFFAEQMGRLNQAGIPVFLLYGNHDAESQITKPLALPENVRVFGSRKAQSFPVGGLKVTLHGQSFREKAVTTNLVPGYPSPTPGHFNIGVLHTGLGGMGGHDNYAPCTVQELTAKGYGYWALGHVHQRQILHEHPWVAFSGNIQGRHVRETGPKGAYRILVEDGEVSDVAPVDCDVVRWADLSVTVTGVETLEDAVAAIRDTVEEQIRESAGRLLACRVRLTGRTPLHAQLVADPDHLLNNARAASVALPDEGAWIERILIETTLPAAAEALAARQDALGELLRMIDVATQDETLCRDLKEDISGIVGRMTHESKELVEDGVLLAALEDDYAAVIREAMPFLVARLTADD